LNSKFLKFSAELPSNIALRHRICTDIATKVKDLGYSGDCGYNQLLYPVENQTRSLLTWLVQKLPRTEDERVDDVIGTNSTLSRQIILSLSQWKAIPWKLYFCSHGVPLRNCTKVKQYVVLRNLKNDKIEALHILKTCCSDISPEPSIFEKHAYELIEDCARDSQFEISFDDFEVSSSGVLKTQDNRHIAKSYVKQVLSDALATTNGNDGNEISRLKSVSSLRENQHFNWRESKRNALVNQTFADLVRGISSKSTPREYGSNVVGGTRFMHATAFAHESTCVIDDSSEMELDSESRERKMKYFNDELDKDLVLRKERLVQEEKLRQQEIDALREEVQGVQNDLEVLERQNISLTLKCRQCELELKKLLSESEALESEVLLKRKTLEMLPNAQEHILKLQSVCDKRSSRLIELSQEWEQHKNPILDRIRQYQQAKTLRRNKCRILVEEIRKFREEMLGMAQSMKEKQDKIDMLIEEKEKLPSNINRALYTHRIMDIITSINKQKKEIEKITSNIHEIQKSINSTTSSLQRADALAEEMIYGVSSIDTLCTDSHRTLLKAANGINGDKAMVDAYRRLRNLRKSADDLLAAIERTGQQEKLIRDLETKIDQETSRLTSNNIERIAGDLNEIRSENAKLVDRLKTLKLGK
jgi:hypothetical protein